MAAACLDALAALAHLACIAVGAPAYRLMGAGERMARAAEAGNLRPTLVTLAIATVLFVWAAYALAGAGLMAGLPLVKPVLVFISAAYLFRAGAFPLLRPIFPENREIFWRVSSSICFVIGCVHIGALALRWQAL